MTRVAALGFTAACAAFLLLATGGSAADSFTLTKVAETSTTITFTYPQQPGYGYLYSADGQLVSSTNDPARTSVKFSKNTANSYDVDSKVKGSHGHCCDAPPPPPPTGCDLNATTANFAAQVAAATTGQSVCLASGNYGTFTGTNKAITIKASDGASPQMKVNLGSGDANFTLDGMTGMGGTVNNAVNVTITNSKFTSAIDFGGNNQHVVLSNSSFDWNEQSAQTGGDIKINLESSGSHTIANPAVTVSGNSISNGDLDGVRVGTATGMLILNNHFENLCDAGHNHTDNIQFYGTSSQIRIAGNYIHENCGTQGIAAYDGGTTGIVIENNVVDIPRPWGIELYADKNSVVRHNTVVYRPDSDCSFSGLTCGKIDINRKSADPAGTGTHVYDNVADVQFQNGSSGTSDHNVSGKNAVYVGPLNTHDGFLLAAGSVGKGAASDGTDAGVYANG